MGKVIWSPTALRDLDSIAEYIALEFPQRATLMATRIVDATDRLRTFPQFGRVTQEEGKTSHREIVVWPYRVTYTIKGRDVWITRVLHGARDRR